jgi:hypothetical protein
MGRVVLLLDLHVLKVDWFHVLAKRPCSVDSSLQLLFASVALLLTECSGGGS